MATGELGLLLFCYLQPPVLGFVLFMITKQGLINKVLFSQLRGSRKRLKSIRFFECAVYARLIGQLRYDIQALSFAVIFIIYDVDLLFFFSEVIAADHWSLFQLFLFILYAIFLILGLWYDISRQNLNWSN